MRKHEAIPVFATATFGYITEQILFYSFTFLNSSHNELLSAYLSNLGGFGQLDYSIGSG
ncbi:hypothetical protein GCM10027185_45470 [Spirosoma pulveris]